jgi:hypothetical protein
MADFLSGARTAEHSRGIPRERRVSQIKNWPHVRICKAVEDALPLATSGYEATPTQARQVVRNAGLLHAERIAQRLYAFLTIAQLLEDAEAHGIIEAAEPLSEQFEMIDFLAILDEDLGAREGVSVWHSNPSDQLSVCQNFVIFSPAPCTGVKANFAAREVPPIARTRSLQVE